MKDNEIITVNKEYIQNEFQRVLKEIIEQGGDTDNNATVLGGLIGAFYGLEAIPFKYLYK
jgi:ADP-ribosylglycohydrolase